MFLYVNSILIILVCVCILASQPGKHINQHIIYWLQISEKHCQNRLILKPSDTHLIPVVQLKRNLWPNSYIMYTARWSRTNKILCCTSKL